MNALFPGFSVPISKTLTIGVSPGFGISGGTLTGSGNISVTYDDGNFRISGGLSENTNQSSFGLGVEYKGYGASYSRNYFNAVDAQKTAQIGVKAGDFSFRLDEDYFVDKYEDKFRTGGMEIGVGDFYVGLSVYTNDAKRDNGETRDLNKSVSPLWGQGKIEAWKKGETYFSPAWVGFKNGNQITRVGYSAKGVQDFFQNGIHRHLMTWHYYLDYNYFTSSAFSYIGYYNPFAVY